MDNGVGLVNYMEDIVRARMPEVLKSIPDVCKCPRCDLDRLAYALNNLPPKYVVTTKGKLYAKLNTLEGQFETDIIRIIMDAAIRVDQTPRHDDDE
jgi:competence protein ComFB